MLFSTQQIKNYWKKIKFKNNSPKFVKKVSVIEFKNLKKACKKKMNFI
mgnify:CR=1 FL=1